MSCLRAWWPRGMTWVPWFGREANYVTRNQSVVAPQTTPPARFLNCSHNDNKLAALRRCVRRAVPFGRQGWITRIAKELALTSTLGPRGRPSKAAEQDS